MAKFINKFMQFNALSSNRSRTLYAVWVAFCCLFFYSSMLSFNIYDLSSYSSVYPPRSQVSNINGLVGAQLSIWFWLNLGCLALLLPLPFIASVIRVSLTKCSLIRSISLVSFILVAVPVCLLLDEFFAVIVFADQPIPSTGYIGSEFSQWIRTNLGEFGLILLALLFMVMFSVISLSAFNLSKYVVMATNQIFAKVQWNALRQNWREKVSAGFSRKNAVLQPSVLGNREMLSGSVVGTNTFKDPGITMDSVTDIMGEQDRLRVSGPVVETSEAHVQQVFEQRDNTTQTDSNTREPYVLPDLGGMHQSDKRSLVDEKEVKKNIEILETVLDDFNVKGKIIGYQPGPVVTVYEYQLQSGVKQAKVMSLIDDLALALKVDSIFIFPVKGKRALGVQVPNKTRHITYLGDIINDPRYMNSPESLLFAMGKSISGEPISSNLAEMPHLLMAGATGAGKSVAVNSILVSIISKTSPEDVKFILVDPKMLELSVYEGIPHLLMPVITEAEKAAIALKWAVAEMEKRYKLMQDLAVRNIDSFNEKFKKMSNEERQQILAEHDFDDMGRLPKIVIVIDELADLMLSSPKEVESCIQRLAQKARASGIHMILATQRPSVDVITGVIKANLPCRIAFQVVSRHDSRTILDQVGAEKLLGKGDMLFMKPGRQKLERIQGALVSDEEVIELVSKVKTTSKPSYNELAMKWIDETLMTQDGSLDDHDGNEVDEKFSEAVKVAMASGFVSASFLQRRMKIGYNRAARIVEYMEQHNMVEPSSGSKPRKWLGIDSMSD